MLACGADVDQLDVVLLEHHRDLPWRVVIAHQIEVTDGREPADFWLLAERSQMSPVAVWPILYAAPPTHPAESVPHVGTERGNPVDEPHITGLLGRIAARLRRSANSFSASPTANPVGLRKRRGWFVVLHTCVWLAPHSDRQLAAGSSGEFCRRRVRIGGSEVRRPSTAPRVTRRRCDNASARSDRSGLLDHDAAGSSASRPWRT